MRSMGKLFIVILAIGVVGVPLCGADPPVVSAGGGEAAAASGRASAAQQVMKNPYASMSVAAITNAARVVLSQPDFTVQIAKVVALNLMPNVTQIRVCGYAFEGEIQQNSLGADKTPNDISGQTFKGVVAAGESAWFPVSNRALMTGPVTIRINRLQNVYLNPKSTYSYVCVLQVKAAGEPDNFVQLTGLATTNSPTSAQAAIEGSSHVGAVGTGWDALFGGLTTKYVAVSDDFPAS